MKADVIPHDAIDTRRAVLPANYQNAKTAIQTCERIDECKDWADKAAALASYAKQANDDSLWMMANRIQMRATRRMGELLKSIPPDPGGRPKTSGGAPTSFSRAQAAKGAGLSRDQKHTALRVASVPEEEFEQALDSERLTVTEMAERGTRKKPIADLLEDRDPKEFEAATHTQGELRRWAEWVEKFTPEAIVRGSRPKELPRMARQISIIQPWLQKLARSIRREISP